MVDGIDGNRNRIAYGSQIFDSVDTRTGYKKPEYVIELRIYILAVLLRCEHVFKCEYRLCGCKIKLYGTHIKHRSGSNSSQISIRAAITTATGSVLIIGTGRNADIACCKHDSAVKTYTGRSTEELPNLITTSKHSDIGNIEAITTYKDVFYQLFEAGSLHSKCSGFS